MDIKGIVFDMEGTVISSGKNYSIIPKFHGIYRKTLSELTGKDYSDLDGEQIYSTIKLPFDESVKILKGWGIDDPIGFWAEVEKKDLKMRSSLDNGYFATFPDAKELLERNRNNGIKYGLLTNCPESITRMILSRTGLSECFDDKICFMYKSSDSKPSGWGISRLLEKWGIAPEHALMIGDAEQDVESGKDAGVWTGQVFRDGHPELRGPKADIEGKDLLEIWEKCK